MKSIEILRRERLHKENDRIAHLLSLYNDSGIDAVTKSELLKRINFCKKVIGNLNETVDIVIAKHANLLIDGINQSLKYYQFHELFFSDINKYLEKVAGLKFENNLYVDNKNGGYNLDIQRAILFFNFTYGEIKKIMFMNRDEFIEFINLKYGTSIPMINELVDAKLKWSESCDDLAQVKNAKEMKLLGVRNGAYIQTEYPLFFERDVISQYEELELSASRKLKL